MASEKKTGEKKSFQVPHILIILSFLIVLVCLLSYIVPAGQYQMDENGRAIAGTFQYVDKTPFSPWRALLGVSAGIQNASSVIAMLFISGGALAVIIGTGAFEEILNYGVWKLQEKSVLVLVPSIVVLMSVMGTFAGSDSMIAFVTLGLVICKRLRLDRIVAMAMFYLGYLLGQGASFTSNMVITFQLMTDVEPLSGMGVRIFVWVVFTVVNATYCTRYALKISKDPSKSILGEVLAPDDDMEELSEVKFPLKGFIVFVVMISGYFLFAYGGKTFGWGTDYLMSIITLVSIFAAIVYRTHYNDFGATFLKGAQSMGGIALIMGLARVVGTVITQTNLVYTIANAASNVIGTMGLALAGVAIFAFTLLFNLVIPSGLSKAAIILPVLTPIGDVCGITRQVIAMIYQMGDSLSNTLTPLSGPLVGSLGLAGVDYTKWLKYAMPLMGILIVFAGVLIAILTGIGWVG